MDHKSLKKVEEKTLLSTYLVPTCHHPLSGVVRVPGSKSMTNRALPIAALASGTTVLKGALFSDDSRYFIESLHRLGYRVETDESRQQITIEGAGLAPLRHPNGIDLFVGNSGTSARFLAAFVSLGEGRYRIDGIQRMRERPIAALLHALQQVGISAIDEHRTGCPPILIEADGFPGGKISIRGKESSQYLSGLLLAAPYAGGPIDLYVEGTLVSVPYVNMTVEMMKQFGATVTASDDHYHIEPSAYQAKNVYPIEPDASSASYFLAAAALCGGTVRIEGLGRESLQGDAQFARVLEKMGCLVNYGANFIELTGPQGHLSGIEVDLFDMSDMVPTLAAIAPFASDPVRIFNVANVRIKETDRIQACVKELRKFGVRVEETEDSLTVYPEATLKEGVSVKTYDDHRIAMAFSILGLKVKGTVIEDPGCTHKTFPNYFELLEKIIS